MFLYIFLIFLKKEIRKVISTSKFDEYLLLTCGRTIYTCAWVYNQFLLYEKDTLPVILSEIFGKLT